MQTPQSPELSLISIALQDEFSNCIVKIEKNIDRNARFSQDNLQILENLDFVPRRLAVNLFLRLLYPPLPNEKHMSSYRQHIFEWQTF